MKLKTLRNERKKIKSVRTHRAVHRLPHQPRSRLMTIQTSLNTMSNYRPTQMQMKHRAMIFKTVPKMTEQLWRSVGLNRRPLKTRREKKNSMIIWQIFYYERNIHTSACIETKLFYCCCMVIWEYIT